MDDEDEMSGVGAAERSAKLPPRSWRLNGCLVELLCYILNVN